MSREQIQQIALSKKIPLLVHFTRAQNVASIMQHGLLPVSVAQERGLCPVINDTERLDGRLNGTSLSIAFPNGSMFFRLRNENPNVDWVTRADLAPGDLLAPGFASNYAMRKLSWIYFSGPFDRLRANGPRRGDPGVRAGQR